MLATLQDATEAQCAASHGAWSLQAVTVLSVGNKQFLHPHLNTALKSPNKSGAAAELEADASFIAALPPAQRALILPWLLPQHSPGALRV